MTFVVLIVLAIIWALVLIPAAIRARRGELDFSARERELDFWAPRRELDFWGVPTEPPEGGVGITKRTLRRVVAYLGLVDDGRDNSFRAFGGFGGFGGGSAGCGGSGGGGC